MTETFGAALLIMHPTIAFMAAISFTYIAIGRRKGYENPQPAAEVISDDYTDKLSKGLRNDNDRSNSGERLYYKDGQLVIEKYNPPEILISQPEIRDPEPQVQGGSR